MGLEDVFRFFVNAVKLNILVIGGIFRVIMWVFRMGKKFTPTPRFYFPFASRFEHTHIFAGSGHGKTQLLQHLINNDLEELQKGNGSVIVIDSQGDMIKKILSLKTTSDISDRLVVIDPTDIEHPPCLNLFDFGLGRLKNYDALEQEKLINGAISLYEYVFGALLGAELTIGRALFSATLHAS